MAGSCIEARVSRIDIKSEYSACSLQVGSPTRVETEKGSLVPVINGFKVSEEDAAEKEAMDGSIAVYTGGRGEKHTQRVVELSWEANSIW